MAHTLVSASAQVLTAALLNDLSALRCPTAIKDSAICQYQNTAQVVRSAVLDYSLVLALRQTLTCGRETSCDACNGDGDGDGDGDACFGDGFGDNAESGEGDGVLVPGDAGIFMAAGSDIGAGSGVGATFGTAAWTFFTAGGGGPGEGGGGGGGGGEDGGGGGGGAGDGGGGGGDGEGGGGLGATGGGLGDGEGTGAREAPRGSRKVDQATFMKALWPGVNCVRQLSSV